MSLVSDALRKARQETAQREGRPGPSRFPPAIVHSSRGSRLGLGLVLGAVITLLAAVGGGLVAWWVLGTGVSRPPIAGGGPTSTLPAAGSHDQPLPAGEHAPSKLAPAAQQLQRQPPAPPAAVPAESGPAVAETAPTSRSAHGSASPAAASSEAHASLPTAPPVKAGERSREEHSTRGSGPREFVAEARVGDTTLVLDYIAYRPSDPFAQINGIEVHEGSHLDGFTVENIERDRVDLRDERGLLVLRVR